MRFFEICVLFLRLSRRFETRDLLASIIYVIDFGRCSRDAVCLLVLRFSDVFGEKNYGSSAGGAAPMVLVCCTLA